MNIICGTDFTKPAMQAANAASALAKRWKEKLVLAHVVEPGTCQGKVCDMLIGCAREQLQVEARRLRSFDVIVQTRLLTGQPDEELVRISRKRDTRLIVLSSLGHRLPERCLLGNISELTAERAAVPTLVVREGNVFQLWARGKSSLKVFVALDFSLTAQTALHWVKELTAIGRCDLTIVHVNWPPEDHARLGITGSASLTQNPVKVQKILERDLKDLVSDVLGSQKASIRVIPSLGRPDATIINIAQAEHADLVVAGTHARSGLDALWHGSVTRGLLHNAPMNVVVVPTPPELAHKKSALPRFRRVLVTTDFSTPGNHAVPYAYAALNSGGAVKLLHVADKQQKRKLNLRQKLQRLIPAETKTPGIVTEVKIIKQENVAKAICEEAEHFGADLICMGSHGRSGLSKALLGSVTQKVMTRSSRPVLVIRPPAP